MSGPLKKVRFIAAWQSYRVGDIIQPNGTLRQWLIGNGYAELVEEAETPARPARFSRKAAQKVATGAKQLFGN